jgi:hypothetical protein
MVRYSLERIEGSGSVSEIPTYTGRFLDKIARAGGGGKHTSVSKRGAGNLGLWFASTSLIMAVFVRAMVFSK